jgi:hypothetical protein
MSDNNKLDKVITEKLIMKLLYEIKNVSKDRNINDYKLSEKIKKVLEGEVK